MHRTAVVFVAFLLAPGFVAGAALPDPSAALRPQGRTMARLLERALDSSGTVRSLAARVAASDVIVYLETERALPTGMAACLTWMATTASHRIVRISLRPGLRQADAIGLIAHELQHAVEVVDAPDVISSDTLDALYRRIGERGSSVRAHWDTPAAVTAGEIARMEALGLRGPSSRRSG
ncbi:MAG: hypothetical protein R2708_20020 [Vicinamibacterales bacterium]